MTTPTAMTPPPQRQPTVSSSSERQEQKREALNRARIEKSALLLEAKKGLQERKEHRIQTLNAHCIKIASLVAETRKELKECSLTLKNAGRMDKDIPDLENLCQNLRELLNDSLRRQKEINEEYCAACSKEAGPQITTQ